MGRPYSGHPVTGRFTVPAEIHLACDQHFTGVSGYRHLRLESNLDSRRDEN